MKWEDKRWRWQWFNVGIITSLVISHSSSMIHLLQQQRLRNGLISILFFCFCGSRFTHALLFATPTQTCLHLHPITLKLKEQSTDREPTAYYQRSRQERSSPRDRKPRFYWKSPDNLRKELVRLILMIFYITKWIRISSLNSYLSPREWRTLYMAYLNYYSISFGRNWMLQNLQTNLCTYQMNIY